jgi:hypothetical protein
MGLLEDLISRVEKLESATAVLESKLMHYEAAVEAAADRIDKEDKKKSGKDKKTGFLRRFL